MTDRVIGAWRNGLSVELYSQVEAVDERRDKGFRLLPYESTVSELSLLLDADDAFFEEILTSEPACCMEIEELHEEAEKKTRKK